MHRRLYNFDFEIEIRIYDTFQSDLFMTKKVIPNDILMIFIHISNVVLQ